MLWCLLLGFALASGDAPATDAPDAPVADGPLADVPLADDVRDMRADLNLASVEQLAMVYGIGRSKAEAIVRDRIANGPFRSVNALERVTGIGPSTLEKVRANVKVGDIAEAKAAIAHERAQPRAPSGPMVDINTATVSEIDELPGIGPSRARAIVEDRDKRGPFRSCRSLSRVVGIGDTTLEQLLPNCTASKVERVR